MDTQLIGKFLMEIRKYYNITQEDLAIKLLISRQAISKWETGVTIPDISTLMKLSQLYNVTINDIIEADFGKIQHEVKLPSDCKQEDTRKIMVIGCGRWGTFIGWYLDYIGHQVTIYGRENSENMKRLIKTRRNEYIRIPNTIELTQTMDSIDKADILIISVNAQGLSVLIEELSKYKIKNKTIILCMKGIDIKSCRRLSQIIDDEMDHSNKTAVWLGPGHIEEYYKGIPNCMVIDSSDELCKNELIKMFSSKLIRFYFGTDLVGNEIGAASKNVIGIAAGMLDGLELSSLKGALMSRAPREIAKLIKAAGGKELTAYGLCHLGDYEATLFSKNSHNRMFGEKYVKNEPYEKLAEGYYTVKALVNMAKNHGIDLPICMTVYDILYLNKNPRECIEELFLRSLKEEFI